MLERDGKFYKKRPISAITGTPIKQLFIENGQEVYRYDYVRKEIGYELIEITEEEYRQYIKNLNNENDPS